MKKRGPFLPVCICCLLAAGCSINRMAVKAVSNALTGEGSGAVFTGDNDPELVGEALPFAIKLYESLLSMQPEHQGLILTTGSLFVMYANAFVQGPAEMLPPGQYREKKQALERAKNLYLRGAEILCDGLDKKYPGFSGAWEGGKMDAFLGKLEKEDVPSLYWTVAAMLSAYSLDIFDFELGARIPELTALIGRAYDLDPDFNSGALDEFYLLFYASLPESMGGNKALAETHFARAVEKSGGLTAGPYVSYAQVICVPAQDHDTFSVYLEKALAVDPEADPANRLVNTLAQRKARYLLDSMISLFPDLPSDDEWDEIYETY